MTAQIAIMNREAVALASDSAVTLSQESDGLEDKQKIFTSANKLFTLSKYQPIGIMVYGSAEFMGIPLETIVKVYRNQLGDTSFNTLKEYGNDFIKFLDNGNKMFPESVQETYIEATMSSFFEYIKSLISEEVQKIIITNGRIGRRAIRRIITNTIKEQYFQWIEITNIPSIPNSFNKELEDKYEQVVNNTINNVFENMPLSSIDLRRLKKISPWLFSRYPEHIRRSLNTGIVVAGFGTQEMFPSLVAYDMELIVMDKLKYREYHSSEVNFNILGSIIPFAQGEMVHTFMEGIAPDCKELEASALDQAFKEYTNAVCDILDKYTPQEKEQLKARINEIGENALQSLTENLAEYRQENYVDPITTVVAALPKDELAAMAESFVHLTSLQKRYTMEAETVGGAIDVAVISKGDGFIWIKRKHYFQSELNPGFIQRYYEED
ncbi:MAG TPA: hypothetical protein G4O15_00775 [Dehalococcoidia bacterium]|nr:hypothetical protein [Dehalococcoidia bacterium]